MSVGITIGQLISENLNDPDKPKVKHARDLNAPHVNNLPSFLHRNFFLMSATGLKTFATAANLNPLFYKEDGHFKFEYPGYIDLTEDVLETILVSQREYVKLKGQPGYLEAYNKFLRWMSFWVNWALNNCEKPVIYLN